MSLEDALRVLNEPENQQLNWALGDLLRERATRPNWRHCPILRHLETHAPNLIGWNSLFRGTRESLTTEADLPRKARTLLRPNSASFDRNLDDFIAEMLAAQYLSALGHTGIRFPLEEDPITTDLISTQEGITYATEAKNLREPNSLAYVAFAHWNRNRAASPEIFNFTAEFLRIDDPFDDLTSEQALALGNLIDTLPDRQRPSEFQSTLPDNRTVTVRIADGAAAMVQYGPGPFLVNDLVEDCQRAVVTKLLEPTRKALKQLYSDAVPAEYRRLLFIRWKPPDAVGAIGEASAVRETVQINWQAFLRQFFPNFALVIMHTVEDMETVPKANW